MTHYRMTCQRSGRRPDGQWASSGRFLGSITWHAAIKNTTAHKTHFNERWWAKWRFSSSSYLFSLFWFNPSVHCTQFYCSMFRFHLKVGRSLSSVKWFKIWIICRLKMFKSLKTLALCWLCSNVQERDDDVVRRITDN